MEYSKKLTDSEKIQLLKNTYKEGTKVRVFRCVNNLCSVSLGTIINVDDEGLIHVNWEDGSSSPLQKFDSYSIIPR